MSTSVYILSAITSLACAILLLRGYRASRARLLFWASLCFAGLALNNILVFIDERVVPSTDLSALRTLPALIGVSLLVFGLVWERQ